VWRAEGSFLLDRRGAGFHGWGNEVFYLFYTVHEFSRSDNEPGLVGRKGAPQAHSPFGNRHVYRMSMGRCSTEYGANARLDLGV
jgi:hypothetical protein